MVVQIVSHDHKLIPCQAKLTSIARVLHVSQVSHFGYVRLCIQMLMRRAATLFWRFE